MAHAEEVKELHVYYTTRPDNPLKKMQSLIVIACKLFRIVYTILKKGTVYDPKKMLMDIRRPEKEGSDCSIRQSTALFIPEPCRVADDSEIGQGSGKKPDNDGVQQALHQHNDQQVTKQGKRPRNIRTLRKGQVSKIKI